MRIAIPALLLSVAIWWPLVSPARAQPGGDAGQRPSFQTFRYDEDWSFLADKSRPIDWLDRLKYIPLGRSNWFASVGGDMRERFELLDAPALAVDPATLTDTSFSGICCRLIFTSARK
jgi:hypothetical protein